MNLVWIVITIILIGYIGERFVFSKERLPAFLRDIFLTGWEFILIGMLIGPAGLAVINEVRLEQLDPFIALGLGWAGLIFGSQLRRGDLAKIDKGLRRLTVVQSVAVWAGLFLVYFVFSLALFRLSLIEALASSLIVAGAGAISSPTALSLVAQRFPRSKTPIVRQLMVIASLDLAPALVMIGTVFCFFQPGREIGFSLERGFAYLFYSLMVAVALAGLFRFFGRERLSPEEDLAALIGFIVFTSGIAFYLSLSPLFLSLLVGVILANVLAHDDKVFRLLYMTEKPFYVMLLIISGMWWSEFGPAVWVMAAAVVVARLWLKRESVDRASSWLLGDRKPSSGAGLALGAQGALALAIGLNFLLVYPGDGPKLAFGVIALVMIVNETMAPYLIRRALGEEEPR